MEKRDWNCNLLIVNAKTGKVNRAAMQAYNNYMIALQDGEDFEKHDAMHAFLDVIEEIEGLN